jgi:hypothetical protein
MASTHTTLFATAQYAEITSRVTFDSGFEGD